MFTKMTIKDVRPRGLNVLVRVDYNVPLKEVASSADASAVSTDADASVSSNAAVSTGAAAPNVSSVATSPTPHVEIESDLRIRASLPTIEYLHKKGARRIILCSHLGRPEGKKVPELSLRPVAERLKELLSDYKVNFIDDVSGPDVEEAVEKTPVGGILLLENLRFYPGEEANSAEFAREIAESTHADLFVQDGFAVVHRAHASTDAITKEVPSVAGLLLEKEMNGLSKISENPAHPFVMVLGGAKVDDKQPLIEKLAPLADKILVGGKIAADGYDPLEGARSSDASAGTSSALASKIIVAKDFATDAEGKRLDISKAAAEDFTRELDGAKTVLWNGTMGKVEEAEYVKGSEAIAKKLSDLTKSGTTTVICGGDTSGYVENLQEQARTNSPASSSSSDTSGTFVPSDTSGTSLDFTLVSTGGGAALELLSGLPLPGVDSLDDK